ncbi:MAG: methionine--tRNA ligase [Holosporales bacterium]|jgi:methionyl-tRNA synthetase|nr:methionine--tRNA ligase [Holosporales bacterium]
MPSKYLITSALPYINGVKHIGNLIGSMLPADVYARYLRQEGSDVLFICGTDEHGAPAELAAKEADEPVDVYCKKMFQVQRQCYEDFCISFDYFGRTSSPSNHKLTSEIFENLYERGFIEEKYISQYYSPVDGRFLPDRYVEGTCPHCGYEKARGDQCDGCGRLLDPEELIRPYSVLSKSYDITLEQTQHYFLNLPKLEGQVTEWVNTQDGWSDIVRGVAQKWIKDGLQARCITRDLSWGIELPVKYQKQGARKVFYVWFDAPNGYISITQDWATSVGDPLKWKEWWQPESFKDVHCVQFMAKDNLPFHTVFWPAMLIGAGMSIKMPDDIKGMSWLTYEKGKFSTSQKRGVFLDEALKFFPADYWRYYLLANCPESSDSDFTFESFAATVNKDLIGVLGNFVNRTFTVFRKSFNSTVPHLDGDDLELQNRCESVLREISDLLAARKFRQATQKLRALWVIGNEYITEKTPWVADLPSSGPTIARCLHLIRVFATASAPFVPQTAQRIADLLNVPWRGICKTPIADCFAVSKLVPGATLAHDTDTVLFKKIEDDVVASLTQRYSGKDSNSSEYEI